ncbi:nuclear transport factor 2 family protein [Thalassomonas actiniarum]|uniref:Nuclear transport factor 2 family protein n=1 Tax=Thalassomonas actiniarum TaxID=485447 RepID=A0AAE9YPR4_9GAMM|nr:nuclear transport factor 2 family protein [Thalassomonas actiniarum]WDD97292.1 nuclear transport factor 2 family protein [Thalassomonas actiniarum]
MSLQMEACLQQWHDVVKHQDMALLNDILADEVEFHSPTVWKPKEGKQITAYILKTVMGIFQDFTYHRQFISGNSVVLEFSAMVAGKNIKGIDMIRWNEQGKIEHFEVMLRPLNGLQAMLEIMTADLQKAGFVPKD